MVLFFVSIYYYLKQCFTVQYGAVFFLVLFIILMRLHTSMY
jgi:hypothetical protein